MKGRTVKRLLSIFVTILAAITLALSLTACTEGEEQTSESERQTQRVLTVAMPDSLSGTGLIGYLAPFFQQDTDIFVNAMYLGDEQAITAAAAGEIAALIANDPAAEEAFIADGYGTDRFEFAYNDFILVGPANDPANARNSANVAEAMAQILRSGSTFLSRADNSGSYQRELQQWALTGMNPDASSNYVALESGIDTALVMAGEQHAYVLTDKASYFTTRDGHDLEVLANTGTDLRNVYSIILVSNTTGVDADEIDTAREFFDWLQSDRAAELIASFGVEDHGEPLYFVDP